MARVYIVFVMSNTLNYLFCCMYVLCTGVSMYVLVCMHICACGGQRLAWGGIL